MAIRETQDFFSDTDAFLEFRSIDVVAGKPPQDGKELRDVAFSFAQLEGAHIGVLNFLCVPFDGEEGPGQAHLERDLLEGALGGRR